MQCTKVIKTVVPNAVPYGIENFTNIWQGVSRMCVCLKFKWCRRHKPVFNCIQTESGDPATCHRIVQQWECHFINLWPIVWCQVVHSIPPLNQRWWHSAVAGAWLLQRDVGLCFSKSWAGFNVFCCSRLEVCFFFSGSHCVSERHSQQGKASLK